MAAVVVLLVFALALGGPITAFIIWNSLRKANTRLRRFAPIIDAEAEASQIRGQNERELAELRSRAESEVGRLNQEAQQLRSALSQLSQQHQQLTYEVANLEERSELQQIALYSPRYHLAHSSDYKQQLEGLWERQKELFRSKRAAWCFEQWTINGNRTEGKRVTDKIVKLMLRAFNGECDALIAKVRYDNVRTYEARIRKSFEDINKLGSGFSCAIAEEYCKLKLEELFLTHEYQEKLQAEREEQRELREQMREEQRAQQELEQAQREAEKEAARYSNALERARAEAEAAVGAKQQRLLTQIAELEVRVQEATDRQRAISMAQQTRRGHVYVLSNIGSFGEHVYKIGMTRRLNPQDRVDELGDASVPFAFDVHAMIKADDAPSLEKALHELFHLRRLNKVNTRKEFFRLNLDEIESVVKAHHGDFHLTKYAEAAHYRQSLAIDAAASSPATPPTQRLDGAYA
jgi:Domain of unknown function (DUF4041)/Meiotically up-regulated gene 113